ncbi:Anti-sigma-K factor RskA [Amycolatopsis pretoriensis]|uniref:Regulator of SigK n=1 Tax=Amycolatopsis pretoriensis TaxID=218821 RepID=A0A1H5RBT7_9PSEU|nr:anti-sigma factor [Amycolatopsis pretoriensis]SEF35840.1 Anti-sigma-K factor RskA [Amycolatopsis pretoriensis]
MTTADAHILAGAYALDAVDDLERAAFTRHLGECPVCAEEVAGFRETAALLATAVAVGPDETFRRRVLIEVSQTRQQPPRVPAEPAVPARRTPWHRRALIGVASVAAAAAVLVGGISIGLDQSVSGRPVPVAEGGAVASAPDATTVRATANGGGSVSATASRQLGKVLVAARELPRLDAGHAYEVWLTGPGAPRSAGLIGAEGTLEVALPTGIDGVAVTVEPATGSLQPTTPSIANLTVS